MWGNTNNKRIGTGRVYTIDHHISVIASTWAPFHTLVFVRWLRPAAYLPIQPYGVDGNRNAYH